MNKGHPGSGPFTLSLKLISKCAASALLHGTGIRDMLFEKLLCSLARADERDLLRPVVTAENANNFCILIVDRTAGKTVTTLDFYG